MLIENDQTLENITAEQKQVTEDIIEHSNQVEKLQEILEGNNLRADQETYWKATNVNETVNKLM